MLKYTTWKDCQKILIQVGVCATVGSWSTAVPYIMWEVSLINFFLGYSRLNFFWTEPLLDWTSSELNFFWTELLLYWTFSGLNPFWTQFSLNKTFTGLFRIFSLLKPLQKWHVSSKDSSWYCPALTSWTLIYDSALILWLRIYHDWIRMFIYHILWNTYYQSKKKVLGFICSGRRL